jgi:hypothetical protein
MLGFFEDGPFAGHARDLTADPPPELTIDSTRHEGPSAMFPVTYVRRAIVEQEAGPSFAFYRCERGQAVEGWFARALEDARGRPDGDVLDVKADPFRSYIVGLCDAGTTVDTDTRGQVAGGDTVEDAAQALALVSGWFSSPGAA